MSSAREPAQISSKRQLTATIPPKAAISDTTTLRTFTLSRNKRAMRAYGIFPMFDMMNPEDARVQVCIALVTEIVCSRLRADGDCFHITIDWRDPGAEPWSACTEGVAQAHTVSLTDPAELEKVVRFSVDPYIEKSASVIRSTATCRAATFGFDGQAFLCLRHDDDAPISPDPALILIEENPRLLTETDYFDGVIISGARDR